MTTKFIALTIALAAIVTVGGAFALTQTGRTTGLQTDDMKTLGHIALVVYGPDGNIKAYRQTDNQVTTTGDNATVNKLFGVARTTNTGGSSSGTFTAVAVGTGGNAALATDTALQTQVGHKVIATTSISTATHGNVVLTANFAAGRITNSSTQTITEAGIFDNTSGGGLSLNGTGASGANMFARQQFTGIGIGPSDTLQITWTVNIT
ncbi:conserved exported protein of unknown function [Nitrosotalea devaniterrae]|uniref:Uncharacterized protein n=1 Tax=Nitrosotalea devaniterrae TaxID=1078905 RepID=A0A128A0H5_9ARCH|nr:conserved exported protein of unknown function [Candidatus Nitrosotalea devanaterra]